MRIEVADKHQNYRIFSFIVPFSLYVCLFLTANIYMDNIYKLNITFDDKIVFAKILYQSYTSFVGMCEWINMSIIPYAPHHSDESSDWGDEKKL